MVTLDPSISDAGRDDPTLRRCIALAGRERFGGVEILDLFAFRAAVPADLKAATDPVGPDNDQHLRDLFARHATILAAWRAHRGRAETVMRLGVDLGVTLTAWDAPRRGNRATPFT